MTRCFIKKDDAIYSANVSFFRESNKKIKLRFFFVLPVKISDRVFAVPANGHELQRLSLRMRHRATHCPPQSRLLVNAFDGEEGRRERKLARGEKFWIISKKSANECREYKAGCICVDEMVVQGFMII